MLLIWCGCYGGLGNSDSAGAQGESGSEGSEGRSESDETKGVAEDSEDGPSTTESARETGTGTTGTSTSTTGLTSFTSSTTAASTTGLLMTTEATASTGMMPVFEDARGIQLAAIEANQGVAIAMYRDGAVVEPEQRDTDLVANRKTLVRATWTLDSGWQPRDITAVLTLHHADGMSEALEQTKRIEGPSSTNSLDETFSWILPPESVTPDLEYSVELRELAAGASGMPAPAQPPRVPADGTAAMGVPLEPMRLKVVMIPLQTPQGTVDMNDALIQQTEDAFFANYPIAELEIEWQEPYVLSGQLQDEDQGFALLQQLRRTDNATPDSYYHLLLDPDTCCAASPNHFQWAGIGTVAEQASPYWADQAHLAMSMVQLYDYGYSTGTMIHEVGHNMGRPHAPCGNPAGPDPGYPRMGDYAEAGIGVQGFNVVTDELYHPFPLTQNRWDRPYKDVMSYCWPQWWSDYNWQNNVERIRAVSSWATGLQRPVASVSALRAHIDATGASWSVVTVDPRLPTATTQGRARVEARDGRDFELGIAAVEVGDADAHVVLVPLPEQVNVAAAELEFAGRTFEFQAPAP